MEPTPVRRRLVQSTLFPQKEGAVKGAESCNDFKEEEEEEEEEVEFFDKRRRRKSKPKTSQLRASSNKATENGKEASSQQLGDGDSPVIVKSDFFLRASEKRQQKLQHKEPICIDSPEGKDEISLTPDSGTNGSTPQVRKRRASSTPKKGKNSTPRKKLAAALEELAGSDEQASRKIPNLRLEAKLTAEENSRVFAGRQIHPFFRSRKIGKTNQESVDVECIGISFERKDNGIAFSPIHVYENVKDEAITLDWGCWVPSEESFPTTYFDLEYGSSPFSEGTIKPLQFDDFCSQLGGQLSFQNLDHTFSHKVVSPRPEKQICPWPVSLVEGKEVCYEQKNGSGTAIQHEGGSAKLVEVDPIPSLSLVEEKALHYEQNNDAMTKNPSCEQSGADCQDRLLQERILSHYQSCNSQSENRLWTDKYHPRSAMQVCGNGKSLKILSEWLCLWHERDSITTRRCNDNGSIARDDDYDCYQSDYDSDNIDGEENLKNVLLVTGPVGSGKSAAIYACAKERGFQVIEVNASDWRTGALIKQKFGEAVESHWLQRSVENSVNPDDRPSLKFSLSGNDDNQQCDNESLELKPLSQEEGSQYAGGGPMVPLHRENKTTSDQNETKTLILFEDVDATLCEDHGFMSTIQQLAESAKRPMILTSNSKDPPLPKNLDRSELCFTNPSMEELLGLVHAICSAEKTTIHPCLIELFVDYCGGDIRKTITYLQFWCQGQAVRKDNALQTMYRPLLFDLDAGHHILPNICPWGYPSQLSEHVEAEIAKSLILMEGSQSLLEKFKAVEPSNYGQTNDTYFHGVEQDTIEAKKEAMLILHFPQEDDNGFTHVSPVNCELSDSSASQIAFSRRNARRNVNAVMSSDSEEECLYEVPVISSGVHHCPAEQTYHSGAEVLGGNHTQFSENVDSYVNCTYFSLDVSCVPESSFVQETEMMSQTEFFSKMESHFHNESGEGVDSVVNNFQRDLEPASGNQLLEPSNIQHNDQEILRCNYDTDSTLVYQELVGNSIAGDEKEISTGYQVLDECSRVDFIKGFKSPLEKPEAYQPIDFVQETWRNFRHHCNDLKQYVTSEERNCCRLLQLAFGMSNLISDVDLLSKDCQDLVCDYLEPSLTPREKSHSYSASDDQLQILSVVAEHGMCFYAKETSALESTMASPSRVDLASEMISSSVSAMALGKLASKNGKTERLETKPKKSYNHLKSELDPSLHGILQSMVPTRSFLALNGDAFYEYLSSLSQISRSEESLLSNCVGKRQRGRARSGHHYLSSGANILSAEEISFLGKYNYYGKPSRLDMKVPSKPANK